MTYPTFLGKIFSFVINNKQFLRFANNTLLKFGPITQKTKRKHIVEHVQITIRIKLSSIKSERFFERFLTFNT